MGGFAPRTIRRLTAALAVVAALVSAVPVAAQSGLAVLREAELARLGRSLGLIATPTQSDLLALLRTPSVYADPRLETYHLQGAADDALVSLLRDDQAFLSAVRGSLEGARLFRQTTAVSRLCGTPLGSASPLAGLSEVIGVVGAPSASFARVSKTLDADYAGLNAGWLTSWASHPDTESFVNDLLALTDTERATVLARVSEHPPQDPALERLVRLALYDRGAWGPFLLDIAEHGAPIGELEGSLLPVIQNMPEEMRTKLIGGVRVFYPKSAKEPQGRGLDVHYPRRALDILERGLDDPAVRFLDGLADGKTVAAAYDAVLAEGLALAPAGTELAYATQDLMAAARELQTLVRAHAQSSGEEIEAWIVGSVPNGKAKRGSDFDVHTTNEDFAELLQHLSDSGDWVVLGSSRARLNYNCCSLSMTHVSVKNPFAIRVTPTRIDLEVYPLPSRQPNQLPRPPPPRRFPLDAPPE